MIEIANVSNWYGALKVLDACTARIEKGKVVVVCGPSGSGKSTLIKCIKDPLHNSGEGVADGSAWDARRLFAVNSWLLKRKTTQQAARVRLITDRHELCRGSLTAWNPFRRAKSWWTALR